MSTPVGDERGRDDRAGGRGPGAPGPITVEQLIARSGNASGRRAARRTGEVPIPLDPSESLPPHRGPRPPVPPATRQPAPGPDRPPVVEDPGPRRGLPPVPGGPVGVRPSRPVPPLSPPDDGVHRSQPVPPLPGAGHRSGPVPPLPGGVQRSAPVPPLPGTPGARPSAPLFPPLGEGSSRRPAPLPPIPGLDPPATSGAGSTRRSAAPRPPRSPFARRMIRAGLVLALVLGLGLLYHLGLYSYADQRIARVAALAPEGPEVIAPQLQERSTTYLVVGTGLPGTQGPASVTSLLVHVAADQERAALVSVPPTALVDTPACRTEDGDVREPVSEAFAASLLDGGPACMVRAVQQMSGLRVDHYLAVDLGRLPSLVDAVGGVGVCLPAVGPAEAASAAPLPAGSSRLTGRMATGYLTPGDVGADVTGTAAAQRTQLLLSATLRTAVSTGTMLDTVELTRFLTRAADALTVDEQTTLGDLRTLATALGDLDGGAVQRAGLPVAQVGHVPAGGDQAYVLLDGAAVRSLFDDVIEDTRVPEELAAPAVAAATAAAPEPAPAPAPPDPQAATVAPAAVTVDVLNGTATRGLASTVADQLRAQGFTVGQVGNETSTIDGSVVRHGPGSLAQARTVAAAVPGAVLQPSDAPGDAVQLVVGPGYTGVVPVPAPAPAAAAAAAPPAGDTAAPQADAAVSTGRARCS